MNSKPLIAVFGGGNIGRGFIGQLFVQANYDVVFIDAAKFLVDELNRVKYYNLQLVSNESEQVLRLGPVNACLISDVQQVNSIIARADIMATAVGVPILPHIASTLAGGIKARRATGNLKELDILVCENKLGAGEYLKSLILEADPELEMMLNSKVGFVETSIGRMVPVLSEQDRLHDPLLIRSEPYSELPVDAAGFRGQIPEIKTLQPFTPFHFYHERKLFIHNMGHASTAYLGWLAGAKTIDEAISDPRLRGLVEEIMRQSGRALSTKYKVDYTQLENHIQDLLSRFANKKLGDTVARVGRDPLRKLDADDRLAGALRLIVENEEEPNQLANVIAAALLFSPEGDPTAIELRNMLDQQGIDTLLVNHCGLGDTKYDRWRRQIAAQTALLMSIFPELY